MARRGALRSFVSGVAALAVLSLAVLPPEHLHLTRTQEGHHSDVVHRHYSPHQPAATGASIGDHDDQPVWLDATFTTPARVAAGVRPLDAVLNQGRPAAPAPLKRLDPVAFTALLVHDPPLTTPPGLRAPPADV